MRKSGVLLHPTSLPGKFGIGDFGESAYRFAAFLQESGQRLWQVLPLGPTGYGYSPYQCYSSIAGNPLLIGLQELVKQGWLTASDLDNIPGFSESAVDFESVIPFKRKLLRKAAQAFFSRNTDPLRLQFEEFCFQNKSWLDLYAEFAALKNANGDTSWITWKKKTGAKVQDIIEQKFIQFEFFRQWKLLKKHCNDHGIIIMGDIPIFVAHDSADVWANPELFDLDEQGNARTVAGVPPDYFSETGQRWGNPLYRWDKMERNGYAWWIERMRSMLGSFDLIRVDHFRGFEKYWEIPGDSPTAIKGRWVEGPGNRLFEALQKALGKLPIIAEDLGIITPAVHELRDRWGFPGMRVLQFAFGDLSPANPYKPHNYIRNCIVYTGTHDNDTTVGWFSDETGGSAALVERESALHYANSNGKEVHWDFIRLALSSIADTAVFPMQDILGLGSEARMNLPSTIGNNWLWRFRWDQLRPEICTRLREMSEIYGRIPK
jgi:4-alpha-glucanotransferase